MELSQLMALAGDSAVMKMTMAFLIAARLHRSWVKKDITEQFKILTLSIDKLSDVVSKGFESNSKRLDEHAKRLDNLESRHNP